MARFSVPTFSDPSWVQTTALDGVPYTMAFTYSQRERTYYLSLATAAGDVLVSGVKLQCNRPLLGKRTTVGLPPGELVVFSSGPLGAPPGLGELGQGLRCELLYYDQEELGGVGRLA